MEVSGYALWSSKFYKESNNKNSAMLFRMWKVKDPLSAQLHISTKDIHILNIFSLFSRRTGGCAEEDVHEVD